MIKVDGDGQCQPESFQAGAVLVKGKRVGEEGWRYWPGFFPAIRLGLGSLGVEVKRVPGGWIRVQTKGG